MDENEYNIGDCVYIEQDPSQPYLIRKIEELQKTSTKGTICTVTCLFRRRDLPPHVLKDADNNNIITPKCSLLSSSKNRKSDKNAGTAISKSKENVVIEDERSGNEPNNTNYAGLPHGAENLSAEDLHCLQQRQLFKSNLLEKFSAKQIRGKCSVMFLSDVDTPEMYLKNDDCYFYSIIYDESTEHLESDKRTIKIGERHQAVIDEPNSIVLEKLAEEQRRKGLATNDTVDEESKPKKILSSINKVPVLPNGRETLIFHPHHSLQNSEIDEYLILSKAAGNFARVIDNPPVTKIPTLQDAAAAPSRDVTQLNALSLLHQSGYDIGKASQSLLLSLKRYNNETGHALNGFAPFLYRDTFDDWSPAEAHVFVDALEKCNKDFHEIRHNYLPWKSTKEIIEYYYMYKTSNQYTKERKSKKDVFNRKHLKRVYILPYTSPSSSQNSDLPDVVGADKITSSLPCESCSATESDSWYNWGLIEEEMRLCQVCWETWKKNGGFKQPHESEGFQPLNITPKPNAIDILQQSEPSNSVSIVNEQDVLSANIPSSINVPRPSKISLFCSYKTSKTFYFRSTILYKIARKLSTKDMLNLRKLARKPFKEIDIRIVMNNLFDRDPVSLVHKIREHYGTINISPSLIEIIIKGCQSSLTASR